MEFLVSTLNVMFLHESILMMLSIFFNIFISLTLTYPGVSLGCHVTQPLTTYLVFIPVANLAGLTEFVTK